MNRTAKLLGAVLLLAAAVIGAYAISQRAESPYPTPNLAVGSPTPSPAPSGPVALKIPDDLFIEPMRQRDFGQGPITQTAELARTANYTTYAISYPSEGHTITGLMNVPKGDGPFPAIILNHGYYPSNTYKAGDGTKREMDYLADRGYLTVAPDYRSYGGSTRYADPTMVRQTYANDVLSLAGALRADNRIKADRMGIWGHSMGGGITLKVLAVQPQAFQAAVVYGSMSANEVQNHERLKTVWNRQFAEDIERRIGSPASAPETYMKLSASTYLADYQTPVSIHHGTADTQVPFPWSAELRESLQDRQKPTEFFAYPGAPHIFEGAAWNEFMIRTTAFYDRLLKQQAS